MSADLLRRMLAAWRESRDPELAQAIVRVGAELARQRDPIEAPAGELEATWHRVAAAADPHDVERLLEAPWPEQWVVARPRVEALGALQPDPRVALGLVRIAARYDSNKSQEFHRTVAAALVRSPFPALAVAIERTRLRFPHHYQHARYLATNAEVLVADRALLAEARGHVSPELLATLASQHAADPDEPGLREALADALIAAHDPRGELIVLQTAVAEGRGSAEIERRIADLVARHGIEWFDWLPHGAVRRVERGFVTAVQVTDTDELVRSWERREWSTVTELVIDAVRRDITPLLLRLPRLRVLVVRHPWGAQGPYVPSSGSLPAVRALGFERSYVPEDLASFPNVRVLGGRWGVPGDNWWERGPELVRGLHQRAARLPIRALVHAGLAPLSLRHHILDRADGPPEVRFAFAAGRHVFSPLGWCVWVPREGPAARIAWCGASLGSRDAELGTILDAFATTTIRNVTASLMPADRAALEPVIERKLAAIARSAASGKQVAPIAVRYDSEPVDFTSA